MKCQPGTTKAMSSEFFLAVHEYKQREMPGPEAARTPVTRMAGSAGSATPCSTPPITWASQPAQDGGWKGCCECALILAVSWGSTRSVSWKDWVPGMGSPSPPVSRAVRVAVANTGVPAWLALLGTSTHNHAERNMWWHRCHSAAPLQPVRDRQR